MSLNSTTFTTLSTASSIIDSDTNDSIPGPANSTSIDDNSTGDEPEYYYDISQCGPTSALRIVIAVGTVGLARAMEECFA